jgi:hypothetical protein
MNIDERLEALTMNLELASRDIQDLRASVEDLRVLVQELRAAQEEAYTKTLRNFEVVFDSLKMLPQDATERRRQSRPTAGQPGE